MGWWYRDNDLLHSGHSQLQVAAMKNNIGIKPNIVVKMGSCLVQLTNFRSDIVSPLLQWVHLIFGVYIWYCNGWMQHVLRQQVTFTYKRGLSGWGYCRQFKVKSTFYVNVTQSSLLCFKFSVFCLLSWTVLDVNSQIRDLVVKLNSLI